MKRALLTSLLGIGTSATVACGQGFVALDNYSSLVTPLITYGAPIASAGLPITGGQWTVGLYFGEGDFVSEVLPDPTGRGYS